MKAAHDVVSVHVGEKYVYQKKTSDRNVKPQDYHVGQAVWLRVYPRIKGQSQSLLKYWDETWIVTKQVSKVHFKILKTPSGQSRVIHSDRLKPHYGPILDAATKKLWLSLPPDADAADRLAVVQLRY